MQACAHDKEGEHVAPGEQGAQRLGLSGAVGISHETQGRYHPLIGVTCSTSSSTTIPYSAPSIT